MATAKQLAARKLFAARAKAGTLRGKPAAKKTVRKNPAVKKAAMKTVRKNPARKTTTIIGARGNSTPYEVQMNVGGEWIFIAATETVAYAKMVATALANQSGVRMRVISE